MTAKTLLEMAGASLAPPALADVALVLIDCQYEYLDGHLALPGVEAAISEAGDLLRRARAAGATVIHVQHQGKAGGLFDVTARSGQIMAEVAPEGDEAVVGKALPNAFAGTELDDLLKVAGRPQLVLAGFMTHMCVSSTARAALDLGYANAIAASACATRDLPDSDGETIPAAVIHKAALAALSDRFSIIVPAVDDFA